MIGMVSEAQLGPEFSRWYVYHSTWFVILLALMATSIFSATYVRLPWSRKQAGFVITHAGLLLLLIGSAITFRYGLEGSIMLTENLSNNQVTVNEQSQVMAAWVDRPTESPYVFSFEAGPVDWRTSSKLNLGTVDGVGVRVLRYIRRSDPIADWGTDASGKGGPLVKFQVNGIQSQSAVPGNVEYAERPIEGTLVDQDYGSEVLAGPVVVRLQRATSVIMLSDFLRSSDAELGDKGVLTAYYQNDRERMRVDSQVGKAMKIGQTGATVELVQYLANAKLDAKGQFKSIGNDARNPLVELKVAVPGEEKPFRQVAFAKSPLLNFDGVYGRDCPVRFTYQHPQFQPATGIELLQGQDGKLYGRTCDQGRYRSLDELKSDSQITLQSGITFSLTTYLPHARRNVSFKPAQATSNDDLTVETASAEIGVCVAGIEHTLWLQRNSAEFDADVVDTQNGRLRVRFTSAREPLAFSLKLLAQQQEIESHKSVDDEVNSTVSIVDQDDRSETRHPVSMNQPLTYRGYRFYLTGFHDAGHGKRGADFKVNYDPGRPWKYSGGLLISLGAVTMLLIRPFSGSHVVSQGDENVRFWPASSGAEQLQLSA